MVNTQLFQTLHGSRLAQARTLNHSGATAYAYTSRHQLAQLAATGCLNQTFYAEADAQLQAVLKLAFEVEPQFVAKTAVYARQRSHMKDMPALLAAVLAMRDVQLLTRVFNRLADNSSVLRAVVQILRSGVVGRKSLGSAPKRLVQQWLLKASETQLLQAAIGNKPSLADVVKLVHPKPSQPWRAAWFAWLIGRSYEESALPPATQAFERFKQALKQAEAADLLELPSVPFQMLTSLPLTQAHWAAIARAASWQMLRQNLNTFARHRVFEQAEIVEVLANKLRDRHAIAGARVLPYQLLTTYQAAGELPQAVRGALQDALEISLSNVPGINGRVVVCPDVSGSMQSPATGFRGSATTVVRCIDIAALIAAAFMHKNPCTRVLPFEQHVVKLDLNARDSVMTNAQKLASVAGGGTCVSAPLSLLNKERAAVDLVVIVSDNESWIDTGRVGATETLYQWSQIKARCPAAKLVCINLQPYVTTQAAEQLGVMNVGGFSDAVFQSIANFCLGSSNSDYWINEIENISLDMH